jgi:hypothetical protein
LVFVRLAICRSFSSSIFLGELLEGFQLILLDVGIRFFGKPKTKNASFPRR